MSVVTEDPGGAGGGPAGGGDADPRCSGQSRMCWDCAQNVGGKDCIEFNTYSGSAAKFWAITGVVLFLLLQLMEEDRFLALRKALDNPELKAGLTGLVLAIIGLMIVGFSLTKRLVHPYEYAVVTFTGPMGLYAAVPIVLSFFAN